MPKNDSKQPVMAAVAAAEAKKAENIAILELDRSSSGFTDFFVICTGSNPRQIQAISDEVDKNLSALGQEPAHIEGYNQAEWILLDYVDFVVHIFSENARKFYDLERLWKSAKHLSPDELRHPKKAAPRKAVVPAAAKKAVKPRKAAAKKTSRRTHN